MFKRKRFNQRNLEVSCRTMNNTPQKLKKHWQENPAIRCERWQEGNCSGRLTKEHCFIYAGKQIQEDWAIIDLCWFHHLGEGMNKQINEFISIMRATPKDFEKFPRKDWLQRKKYLVKKYG